MSPISMRRLESGIRLAVDLFENINAHRVVDIITERNDLICEILSYAKTHPRTAGTPG